MATIKHKRGTRAALDASPGLQQGELGLCTDTGELFIGNNGNHPILEQVAAKTLMGNTGSDKALPSAIPAADILEMIGGQAVIQYEVMPATVTEGAVVQYIGEDTAEYVSGSWYRGENGEWVATSGGGGVYVGSGDMPDGYNVQIDPSGDVLDLSNYALTSHNHDDVYATSEALNNKQDNITVSGILKGLGDGGVAEATPGADYANPAQGVTVTLPAAGWSDNIQTVSVQGATATNVKVVSPAYASVDEYASCGVKAAAEGAGTITFACTTVPENDLIVNVAILG